MLCALTNKQNVIWNTNEKPNHQRLQYFCVSLLLVNNKSRPSRSPNNV